MTGLGGVNAATGTGRHVQAVAGLLAGRAWRRGSARGRERWLATAHVRRDAAAPRQRRRQAVRGASAVRQRPGASAVARKADFRRRASIWPGDLVLAQERKRNRRAQESAAARRGQGPIQVRHATEKTLIMHIKCMLSEADGLRSAATESRTAEQAYSRRLSIHHVLMQFRARHTTSSCPITFAHG